METTPVSTPTKQRKDNPDEHALVTRIPKTDLARIDGLASVTGLARSQMAARLLNMALDLIEKGVSEELAQKYGIKKAG